MSSLNFRKNLLGAAEWLISGQFADDIADEFRHITMGVANVLENSGCFTSEELRAFSGEVSLDNSWKKIDHDFRIYSVSPERARYFMENTQSCATIMCNMLERLKDLGLYETYIDAEPILGGPHYGRSTNPMEIIRGDLVVGDRIYSADKVYALQGNVINNGFWYWDSEPDKAVTEEEARYFMEHTQSCASLMCEMREKMKRKGIYEKFIDTGESSDITSHAELESTLIPSCAFVPSRDSLNSNLASYRHESVIKALLDAPKCIQSFFGELELLHKDPCLHTELPVLSDDVLHAQPFDESLFCKLVLENHRYTLAQLYDARHEAAEQKAKRWMKYGILAGIVTLNPLMPFFLSNQGRINASKGTKLEELIPDPYLMFMQDKYSFLKMTHGGTPMPQMRRVIFHPVITGSSAYLRIIPAALTQTSVIPLQVFKVNDARFLRPVCAGIDPEQPNYNAQRIHRLYYHLRADGKWKDTGERIAVCGSNIDDSHRYRLYHFSSDSRELEYYYIDYQTEPGHVF